MADPSLGTELTVDTSETPYKVTATGLTNGTTYYIYVKVSEVADIYKTNHSHAETFYYCKSFPF